MLKRYRATGLRERWARGLGLGSVAGGLAVGGLLWGDGLRNCVSEFCTSKGRRTESDGEMATRLERARITVR